ncbi:calcium-binding protein [Streptomyces sp. WM6386]|nr:calcium-binding protein [Streptomyces sp. WM6386]
MRTAVLRGAAALALVVALPGSALAAPGDLDTTFGTGGRVNVYGGYWDEGQDLALQADGKIVTVGSNRQAEYLSSEFSVMRHNADGSFDTSFGDNGETVTDFAGGEDRAHAVALQPDGKIVVAGESGATEGGCCLFTVARYNADGSLDTGFGTGGRVVSDVGSVARGVAVQPDGKIVAAGQGIAGPGDLRFMVARYNADGSPDTGFGTGGYTLTPFEGGGSAHDLALQPDGRIVLAGETGGPSGPNDFALARYTAAGGLDTGFGTGGTVRTVLSSAPGFLGDDSARGVAVQSDGKIVAAGYSAYDFALVRYTGSGALDPAFATDGVVTTDFGGNADGAFDLALQTDGRIVAVGQANTDFAVARYTTAGSLDTGFGTGGKKTTDMGFGYFDEAHAVAVQPDGRIVVFGNNGDDRALARYLGGNATGVDLSVTKTGTATVSIGDRATYTVTVTNNSTATSATGVTLSDTFTGPAGTVISATPSQGTCTTAVSCALGTLAPGAKATVKVVAEPRATGTLTERASATATQTDPATANNTATVTTTVNNARGCTRIGTSGNDTLTGTYGTDVICGLGGDDTINASYGNDTAYGDYGNDRVDGGFNDDTLYGGPGNDNLIGSYGNDRLNTVDSVSGNDTANGGMGTDTCTTDTGDTRISCP